MRAELKELLAISVAAAGRAAAALSANRPAWSSVTGEAGREVKVDADRRAEAMIVADLQARTDYPIISEEAGWIAGRSDTRVWAVDPLDGSVNYIQGYPHCAVSIALLENDEPVIGVVDCFLLGAAYAGAAGLGATRNGVAIRPSQVNEAARGVLNTGIPARARTDAAAMNALCDTMRAWRKVRMIGSAAAALAYVADGSADAYRESGSMIWDVAGGCALVRAAGGAAHITGGDLAGPLEVVATNGVVAPPV
ncbi:MAG: inositol monophosphatase [Hyphomonadaceae bacterium]